MNDPTLFLLSPAHCGGKRAALLARPAAEFDLAVRIRRPPGVELGEAFSFVSGLYFRGKVAYAEAFARPPASIPGALVITAGDGLLPLGHRIGLTDLSRFAAVPIDPRDARYREPLRADVERLAAEFPAAGRVVLLGSVATSKYVEILISALGDRLCFPEQFIGMGDMQRGAMMLRAARAGVELAYVGAEGAVRSRAVRGPGAR